MCGWGPCGPAFLLRPENAAPGTLPGAERLWAHVHHLTASLRQSQGWPLTVQRSAGHRLPPPVGATGTGSRGL